MFSYAREGDLSIRFYGPQRAVLSRRSGARIGLNSQVALFLWEVFEAIGVKGMQSLTEDDEPAPAALRPAVSLLRTLIRRLDAIDKPVPSGDLKLNGLNIFSLKHRTPIFCLLEITYRCNLRCDHCYVLHKISEASPLEMSSDTVVEVLESLTKIGCLNVTLSGGESTLHRDHRRILREAKDRHLYTIFKTNGMTMTRRNAEAYAEDPGHETHLSLYGSDAQAHETITLRPGSFEKVLRGMRELARAGVESVINVLCWKGNVDQMDEMDRLIKDMGHVPRYSDIIHGRLNRDRRPLDYKMSPLQRRQLVDQGYLTPFKPAPCTAGAMKFKVAPDGGVYVCELLPKACGSVAEAPLEEIWHGPAFSRFGQKVIQLSQWVPRKERPYVTDPPNSCPGLNLLNTGRIIGRTTI